MNISPKNLSKNDTQLFPAIVTEHNTSSASLDISKLDINEPVNQFASRIKAFFDDIQRFKINLENNETKSENEEQCIKFCEDLLQEHIKSLDQLNSCLNENHLINDKLEEANFKIKDLERGLKLEKSSRNDLKAKFEEDEQQIQEENQQKDKLIKTLKAKLMKCEHERLEIYEEKQELLLDLQTEVSKLNKEKAQIQSLNKKLIHEKEIDELQYLENMNILTNVKLELCNLFNLASSYRRKTNLFGKQFINAFDLVFGKIKFNFSNITFLEMPSINEDHNASYLNLKDIVYEELNNFNMILKEKLLQNEEDISIEEKTFIKNNSDLILSGNFGGNFENRLFGNETFNLESLNDLTCQNQSVAAPFIDKIANEILDDLFLEHIKWLGVKALFDYKRDTLNQTNSAYKDQIRFMFRPETSMLNESYYEEKHNNFEESFTENLARTYANNSSGSQPELLKNILEGNNSKEKQNNSLITSRIEEEAEYLIKPNDAEDCIIKSNNDENQIKFSNNLTRVVRKLSNQQSSNNSVLVNANDDDQDLINLSSSSNLENTTSAFTSPTQQNEMFTFNHNSEIQTLAKSKLLNFNTTNYEQTKYQSDLSSNNETNPDLLVTLNKNFNSRSDGESSLTSDSLEESINGSSSTANLADFDASPMQLTNINNLSNVFNELSENQKLNSTVKTDERSNEIKLNKTNSSISSDMSLSDDEEINFKDNGTENKSDSDPFYEETMLSQNNLSYNFDKFYTTIKHDSDYSLMNMEVSDTSTRKSSTPARSTRSKSLSKLSSRSSSSSSRQMCNNRSISLSTLVREFNDDNNILNESCNLHNSSSRCRFRKRKPNWSNTLAPYFSPLFSLITPLFSLLFKILFFVLFIFVFLIAYGLNHFSAFKIYYTSWNDVFYHLLYG